VWQEVAELDAAWEDELPASAELAKVLAGRLVRTAAANCQQVLGGMGFTWEHEFHRYLRRGLLLEPPLGSAAQLRAVVGTRSGTAVCRSSPSCSRPSSNAQATPSFQRGTAHPPSACASTVAT
jgi:Acyl-CoA dehydrogenase, C-terminal domain